MGCTEVKVGQLDLKSEETVNTVTSVPKSEETSNIEATKVSKSSPSKEAALNTTTKESSNTNLNLAMDQDP